MKILCRHKKWHKEWWSNGYLVKVCDNCGYMETFHNHIKDGIRLFKKFK